MRYYSTKGDNGTTSFGQGFGQGVRVPKAGLDIEFVGALDEAQVALGFAAAEARTLTEQHDPLPKLLACLEWMQIVIFNAGLMVMGTAGESLTQKWSWDEQLIEVEKLCEKFAPQQALKDFVLPGGSELAARIELARVAIRRLERVYCQLVAAKLKEGQAAPNEKYADTYREMDVKNMDALPLFNRLSSLAFVLARRSNEVLEVDRLTL